LTAAALALPGLVGSPAHADDTDAFTFEYHHYSEGKRDLNDQTYKEVNLKPIQVDSADIGLQGEVVDRVKFSLNFTQDTWSGATPVTTVPVAAISDEIYSGASRPTEYFTDKNHTPVDVNWDSYNGNTVQYSKDPRLVHIMASASPETRRQVDLKLGYDWDDASVNAGGGVSEEPDYHSRFINTGGTWDFNQKLTTLNWSASYTWTSIAASLAANSAADWGDYVDQIDYRNDVPTLLGKRKDVELTLGLTQILNKDALLAGSIGYTNSQGYLSNPYKATILAFDDPDQFIDSTGLRTVVIKGALEERPRLRDQWAFNTQYIQYIDAFDAALHLDYRFYHDDWNIDAHTFDASWYQPFGNGWMLVPGARYYTQTKAFFYAPYFVFNQAFPILFPRNPELPPNLDFSQIALKTFSSDERLSAFGTLDGQLALRKQLTDTVWLELGAEYSKHAGSLKLGGGGEGRYADFNSYTFYAELNIGQAASELALPVGDDDSGNATSDSTRPDKGTNVPAGVFHTHMLSDAGEFKFDYHYTYGVQNGAMRNDGFDVRDKLIVDHGCGDSQCLLTPTSFFSHEQTLDILYAPLNWLTVALSPELVDMHMDLRPLNGAPFYPGGIFNPGPTESQTHTTGGIGDTGITALAEIFDDGKNHIHVGLSLSAPTGNTNLRLSGSQEFINYAMQLGSGTWDFHPSITYLGGADRLSWGAQASLTWRLENRNGAGYALGNGIQSTLWGGYNFLDWLSGSLRAAYATDGAIKGQFHDHETSTLSGYKIVGSEAVPVYTYTLAPNSVLGPMEAPQNYGGQHIDLGAGLSAVVPGGPFAGNRLSVEWTRAVTDDNNGYQLTRKGTLYLTWNVAL
jgi:hypothetical protein